MLRPKDKISCPLLYRWSAPLRSRLFAGNAVLYWRFDRQVSQYDASKYQKGQTSRRLYGKKKSLFTEEYKNYEKIMDNYNDHLKVVSNAVSKKQLEVAFRHFFGLEPPEITSEAEYDAAKALYAAMDASMPPKDLHSPVARYVVALGMEMTKWEIKNIKC
ncbi:MULTISPECIES: hypothetical protein [Rhodobacterales]|nr:hypothetical protein [Roseinatronobacter thiooxidans]